MILHFVSVMVVFKPKECKYTHGTFFFFFQNYALAASDCLVLNIVLYMCNNVSRSSSKRCHLIKTAALCVYLMVNADTPMLLVSQIQNDTLKL